jgi:DNA polymerase III sliding clamp (beta) subunit (PCNA family)
MINTNALKQALQLVRNALPKKNAMSDVLNSVHVSLDKEAHTMTLTATDLEKASRAVIPYGGDQDIAFTLEVVAINAISRLSEDSCTLVYDGSVVKLNSGRIKLKLPSKDAETFPQITQWDSAEWSTPVAAEALEAIFFSVAHAASKEQSRPSLCGIRFIPEDDKISVFATDGHRLAWYKAPALPIPDILLPLNALASIAKSLKQVDTVQISQHSAERKGSLGLGNDKVLAMRGVFNMLDDEEDEEVNVVFMHSFRLLAKETFPNIQPIIESQVAQLNHEIKIDVAPIRSAIEVARMFDQSQRCVLTFGDRKLFIDSQSELGAANIELDLTSDLPADLADMKIGVSAKYVIDAMASCLDDEVTLRICDGEKPMTFDDGSKLELIMPMKV